LARSFRFCGADKIPRPGLPPSDFDPSNWSTHQENEFDDSTGAEITAWYAIEPGSKHDVRVYVSVESVGLHITAWN
jgi:hypothetical protein